MKELVQVYESLTDKKQIEIVAALLPILEKYEERIADLENKKENVLIDWIDEYINLFPDIKGSGGLALRSNRIDCEKKMRLFVKKYKYPKTTILAATKEYINEQDTEFRYTKTASYFIEKRGYGSSLADACENYVRKFFRKEPLKIKICNPYDFI